MSLSKLPYKGTRDFYPEDKRVLNYIFSKFKKVTELYGYEEYDGPMLESEELYKSKTSDEIVNNQTYLVIDRSNRRLVIRPEITPTVSRMVAAKRYELQYPLRLYSIPNVWRYERQQSGRFREHWQLNVDLFGVDNNDAEFEIINIINSIFFEFGANKDQFQIRINSRKITEYIFNEVYQFNQDQISKLYRLIDQKNKITEDEFLSDLNDITNNSNIAQELLKIFDAKSLDQLDSAITKSEGFKELSDLTKKLNLDNLVFDPTIVRGFNYYTGIVFEVYDTDLENKRSILGGGRYDSLINAFGVESLPVVGFGLGDGTMTNFLKLHNLLPNLKPKTNTALATIDLELSEIQSIVNQLRQENINLSVNSSNAKIQNKIKWAIKSGYDYLIIIGKNELVKKRYNFKGLLDKTEKELSIEQIISEIK